MKSRTDSRNREIRQEMERSRIGKGVYWDPFVLTCRYQSILIRLSKQYVKKKSTGLRQNSYDQPNTGCKFE